MGSCHRTTTGSSQVIRLQDIPYGKRGRRLTMGVHQRTTRKGIHPTIEIPIHLTILLYQEERREATTGTGLLKAELPDCQEPIPPSINPRTNRSTSRCHLIHQTRHSLGI